MVTPAGNIPPETFCCDDIAGMADGLKRAMRLLAASVTVITAAADGRRGGMTATAVCSLSLEPPSLVLCVNRSSRTLPLIQASRRFCVNLLGAHQQVVAEDFAGAATDKFGAASGWADHALGPPMLDTCLANVVCDLAGDMEVGTHVILVGHARHVRCSPGFSPLIYADRRFTTTAPPESYGSGAATNAR